MKLTKQERFERAQVSDTHASLLSLAFFMERNPDEKIETFTELLLRFVMCECFNTKWDDINKVWI